MTRRVMVGVLGVALAVLTTVMLPAGAAQAQAVPEAVETQRTLFDYRADHTKSTYWQPPTQQPANYVSPANYRDGRAYLRMEVTGKKSAKEFWTHLCFWRHDVKRFQYETCSPGKVARFSTNGVHYVDLGAPGRWWKKNGVYDWTKQASIIRIMLKDPVSKQLMITRACGAACYTRGDIDSHLPLNMRGEVILVAAGQTLNPPAHWKPACPDTWGPGCR